MDVVFLWNFAATINMSVTSMVISHVIMRKIWKMRKIQFNCAENVENPENAANTENPVYLHGKCGKYGKVSLSAWKIWKM